MSHLRGLLRGAGLVAEQLRQQAAPELRNAALLASQRAVPRSTPGSVPSADADSGAAAKRRATDSVRAPAAESAHAQPSVVAAEAPVADPQPAPPPPAAPAADEEPEQPQRLHTSASDAADSPRLVVSEAVPASSFARAFEFGKLGASVMFSGAREVTRRRLAKLTGSSDGADEATRTAFVNEENAERMASTLTKLRGAALKLGQILSLQDDAAVPPQLQAVFNRVRASAHIMPPEQLHSTLHAELGEDWRSRVRSFAEAPIASASIGQVHRAVLPDGRLCALKVQYPGVATSVESDLANLKRLATYTGALPKRMFVDNIIASARDELLEECDYEAEAAHTQRYRTLIEATEADPAADPLLRGGKFGVPAVIRPLSSARVLTTELMHGQPIEAVAEMSAARRNAVAGRILALTFRELFCWRFVQTDPNWGNYLYDPQSDVISLIDFGAARTYPKAFVDEYLRMVDACARKDRQAALDASIALGFLSGEEPREMLDAHVAAGFVLGEPFGASAPYDFAASGLSARVREHVPTMLKLRERPPPREIYSLHRKLSGAYMLCIRLRATIGCRDVFERVRDAYEFGGHEAADEADAAAATAARESRAAAQAQQQAGHGQVGAASLASE